MDWNFSSGFGSKNPASNRLNKIGLTDVLSVVLRGGVILSALVIGLGLLLFLFTGQSGYMLDSNGAGNASAYFTFHQSTPDSSLDQLYFPTNPVEIWQGVTELKPFAIIMFGLLLLIATPVVNIALAGLGFIKERNRAFSLISFFILAILILSFFLGKAGG